MKNRVLTVLLVSLLVFVLCSCGNEKFVFSDYKSGDIICNSIDGNIYKLNSKFVMFDDGGFLRDNIVKINSSEADSYEAAGDYYNEGTEYYRGVCNIVYCSEDYLIVTLRNSEKCILIDCSSKKKEAITELESIEKINIDYSDFTKIECNYYVP